jgi:hypothetical protein
MLSPQRESDDDVCPVRDELLGELCRANDQFMPGFVYSRTPGIRASLALFCSRRGHLRSMGLAIASSCNKDDLVREGGHVGAFLFACSQKASPPRRVSRRKISLARGVVRVFVTDDEPATEAVQSVEPEPVPA